MSTGMACYVAAVWTVSAALQSESGTATDEAVDAFRAKWVKTWMDERDVHPNTHCATCHR